MANKILEKAGQTYVEGMKTGAEDLFGMIKGNMPKKRGLIARLKQAAALGATMITLGTIGQVKAGVQQYKAERTTRANIEYIQQTRGWQIAVSPDSNLWHIDANNTVQNYKNVQEIKDHQEYLQMMSRYLIKLHGNPAIFTNGFDPLVRQKAFFSGLDEELADAQQWAIAGGLQNLKRLQMLQKVKEELQHVVKGINKGKSPKERHDNVAKVLRSVSEQYKVSENQWRSMLTHRAEKINN